MREIFLGVHCGRICAHFVCQTGLFFSVIFPKEAVDTTRLLWLNTVDTQNLDLVRVRTTQLKLRYRHTKIR